MSIINIGTYLIKADGKLNIASPFKRNSRNLFDVGCLIKFFFCNSKSYFTYKFSRIYWTIVFLLFVGALCYLAVIQSQRYYEYKTVTQTSIIMEDDPVFPAVTTCNFNLIKNDSVTDFITQLLLKTMYLDDQWNTEEQRKFQFKELYKFDEDFVKTVSVRSLFLNGSPTLDTTIKKCIWVQVSK